MTADTPYRNAIVTLDLQSGVYSLLEGADSPEVVAGNDNEAIGRAFTVDPVAPGRFVETQTACAGNADTRCVAFYGQEANLESAFAYTEPDIYSPNWGMAKRSRDGRHVVMTTGASRLLQVRTMTGEIVSSVEYAQKFSSAYDWLPDGSIVTEVRARSQNGFNSVIEIGLTEPDTATLASSFSLPDAYRGTVLDLAVDPSGSRAAMIIKLTEGDTDFWKPVVLDIASGAVYEPIALGSDTSGIQPRFLRWSPDGEWLMLQDTRTVGFVPVNISSTSGFGVQSAHTFAVRVDGRTHVLPRIYEESTENVRIVLARPLDDPNGALEPRHARVGDVWLF